MSIIRDELENSRRLITENYDNKPTGFKNILLNANGLINQRGYVSGTATVVDNEYTLDRWRVVLTGEALAFDTVNNITTFTAPLNGIEQVIEDITIISGNYTLSYTGTGTATISQSSDNVTYTEVTANTDGSYMLTGGLYTKVTLIDGTFSLIQLEEGSVATPFEQRPYGLELSLCQRYYQVMENIMSLAISTSRINCSYFHSVTPKTLPSYTFYSENVTIGDTSVYNDIYTDIGASLRGSVQQSLNGLLFITDNNSKLTSGNYYSINYIADAEL